MDGENNVISMKISDLSFSPGLKYLLWGMLYLVILVSYLKFLPHMNYRVVMECCIVTWDTNVTIKQGE